MSTRQVRCGAVLGAAAVAVVLAGCSGGGPGVAAVVDGHDIPVSELADVQQEIGAFLGGATTTQVLQLLVVAPAYSDVASDRGVAVSDEQAAQFLTSQFEQAGFDDPTGGHYSAGSLAIAKFSMESSALGEDDGAAAALADRIADTRVEVNPRFGTIDPTTLTLSPTTYPWLVPDKAAASDAETAAP